MEKYTWLNLFASLLNKIVTNYDKFTLNEKFHMLFPDKYENFKAFDPMSFILYLNTGNYDRKLSLINRTCDLFNLDSKISDFNGILQSNDSNPVFFKGGQDSTLDILWEFCKKVNAGEVDKNLFNTIINFKGVNIEKLSAFLYFVKPYEFYPVTYETKTLANAFVHNNYDSYINFNQKATQSTLKPFEYYSHAYVKCASPANKPQTNALNRIIYGAVGTGKTQKAMFDAVKIITGKAGGIEDFKRLQSEGRIKFITFHNNHTYNDFVFNTFYNLSKNALYDLYEHNEPADKNDFFANPYGQLKNKNDVNKYVLIIDEINRGSIDEIFGELITLIDSDKRWGAKNGFAINMSNDSFVYRIPENLYIIGTMNSINTNIMDTTLRRRFDFIPMYPDYSYMKKKKINSSVINLLKRFNLIIRSKKTPDYQIGHSYFMDINDYDNTLEDILNKRIIPLLMQYFNNNQKEVEEILRRDLIKRILNQNGIQIIYDEDGILKAV